MQFQVTIQPSNHRFAAEEGETLLEAALREGYALPYGCRNGSCGACKGKVLAGSVDHGAAQETALPREERDAGMALFCCARPQSDLAIECREVGAVKDIPVKTLPCRVQDMRLLAADVMLLRLRLPSAERLQFLPGQYIDILQKDGGRRSFSLANPPHDDECLELHVRRIPGGQFTEHVFTAMKERDILRFNGPHGSFFLREEADSGKTARPVVLVAGGTGFAPIKSIVEHMLHKKIHRPMTLYWGVRSLADLYLPELPKEWVAAHPDFRFVPVLSDPRPEDAWSGRTGLVHEAVMRDLPDLSAHEAYVCGAPAMVAAARRDFVERCALPAGAFFADSFDFSAPRVA